MMKMSSSSELSLQIGSHSHERVAAVLVPVIEAPVPFVYAKTRVFYNLWSPTTVRQSHIKRLYEKIANSVPSFRTLTVRHSIGEELSFFDVFFAMPHRCVKGSLLAWLDAL